MAHDLVRKFLGGLKKSLQFIYAPLVSEYQIFLVFSAVLFFFFRGNVILGELHGYMVAPPENYPPPHLILLPLLAFFIYAYFAAALVYASGGRRWVRISVYSLLATLTLIDGFLHANFSLRISPLVFTLIIETNKEESSEFMANFVLAPASMAVYLKVLGIVLLMLLAEKYKLHIVGFIRKRMRIVIPVSACLSLMPLPFYVGSFVSLFSLDNVDETSGWEVRYHYHDPFSQLIFSAYNLPLMSHDVKSCIEKTISVNSRSLSCSLPDSLNIVLVIGESYIKSHSGLYGYERNTTPRMGKEVETGNLFVYQDVVTPYQLTNKVVKNVLSVNSMADGELWSERPLVMPIFKKSGWNVFFWDNQNHCGISEGWAFSLNSLLFNPKVADCSYTQTNEASCSYDGDLVESFVPVQNRYDGCRNLVVFHLWGQHLGASSRYPHTDAFEYYNADSINFSVPKPYLTDLMRERIAAYDNATRYNDFVMGRIFDLYRRRNAIVIYFSDHGENEYDFCEKQGRINFNGNEQYFDDILKYQYEIPFVIWCSDTYRSRYPEVVREIEASVSRPFMIDNVCQILFHVARISSPWNKPERDLLAPGYRQEHRIVNDNIDYDSRSKRW